VTSKKLTTGFNPNKFSFQFELEPNSDIARQKNRPPASQFDDESAVFRFVGTPTLGLPGCLDTRRPGHLLFKSEPTPPGFNGSDLWLA
jgi:hypothetical protein